MAEQGKRNWQKRWEGYGGIAVEGGIPGRGWKVMAPRRASGKVNKSRDRVVRESAKDATQCSRGKVKGKIGAKNKESGDGGLTTRCCPQYFITITKEIEGKLTEEQNGAMMKTPFWHFMKWLKVHFMDDLDHVGDYAWGEIAHRFLLKGVEKYVKGNRYADGCMLGLMVWFFKHVLDRDPDGMIMYSLFLEVANGSS